MTVFTYPDDRRPGTDPSYTFYEDPGCTVPATLTGALTGQPYPGGEVPVLPSGSLPFFTATVSPLYAVNSAGEAIITYPTLTGANPLTVTGAKGGNAALTSLIAQLIALGVPIIDGTS